jgi:hypothetical protein
MDTTTNVTTIVEIIGAVGALGTAATGLVDTTKVFNGGVSRVGFATITQQFKPFEALLKAIPEQAAAATLYGLWINGVAIEAPWPYSSRSPYRVQNLIS